MKYYNDYKRLELDHDIYIEHTTLGVELIKGNDVKFIPSRIMGILKRNDIGFYGVGVLLMFTKIELNNIRKVKNLMEVFK